MSDKGTRQNIIDAAYEAGHRVLYGDDQTLQLDIDTEEDLLQAKTLLKKFKKLLNFSNVTYTRSKSEHWHLYVHLSQPMDREQRMLLQGVLGSDSTREILNWNFAKQTQQECFFIEVTEDERLLKL